jgi:hypothetical protein
MPDLPRKAPLELWGRILLKAQVQAAEHIRDCPRCERLFLVAFEAADSEWIELNQVKTGASDGWAIIKELLPEFRQCGGWPPGI